jgi:hypothetical protein
MWNCLDGRDLAERPEALRAVADGVYQPRVAAVAILRCTSALALLAVALLPASGMADTIVLCAEDTGTSSVRINPTEKSVSQTASAEGKVCTIKFIDGVYGPAITAERCPVMSVSIGFCEGWNRDNTQEKQKCSLTGRQHVSIAADKVTYGVTIGAENEIQTLHLDTGILERFDGSVTECHYPHIN